MAETPVHFKGKEVVNHVVEHQVEGILSSTEIHGVEAPGHISAGADAAKDTAIALLLLFLLFIHTPFNHSQIFLLLGIFSFGWLIWKMGRSAWLGWSRLERLHRVVGEEQWEIEHHRTQERDELRALYAAKGFSGKLLEDVLDVLMADGDRLLKVMLEEELGLSLESQEHPLKQSLGAGVGTFISIILIGIAFWISPTFGILAASLLILGFAGALSAYYEKNRIIPAIIWNMGLGVLTYGGAYFLFRYLLAQ
jgi:hypothetical protein